MAGKQDGASDDAAGLKPWQRLSRETHKSFRAFGVFLDLGADRTIKAAAASLGQAEEGLSRWATANDWHDRAAAWDNHNRNVIQAARDEVNARKAGEWEERRLAECEDVYQLAKELRDKARLMINSALYAQKSKDGKTVIRPANWTFATASSLARQSAELTALAISEALEPEPFEPTEATPEECVAFVQRMSARRKAVRAAVSRPPG